MEKIYLVLLPETLLGDFLLMAPYLKKLQEKNAKMVIAVPSFIYDLYHNQEVFDQMIRIEEVEDFARQYSSDLEILNMSSFMKQAPIYFKPKPLLHLDLNMTLLEKIGIKAYEYFTVHSGDGPLYEFETIIESILLQHPESKCVALTGPNETDIYLDHPNFKNVHADLCMVEQLLAGALFHVDNNTPSISIFTPTYHVHHAEKIH